MMDKYILWFYTLLGLFPMRGAYSAEYHDCCMHTIGMHDIMKVWVFGMPALTASTYPHVSCNIK